MLIRELVDFVIHADASVRSAIAAIDRNQFQTALMVSPDGELIGVVTDGDIRRGLLAGVTLDQPASSVLNNRPIVVHEGTAETVIEALMRRTNLWRIPVLDEHGKVTALAVPDDQAVPLNDNLVVLMAGGLGTRLGALTHDTPKPLLTVGKQPILQTILECFTAQGFHRFVFAVNFKAEMIENYFGDGSAWGISIRYVREERRLGTAGALSCIDEHLDLPIFVMNGDLLTRVDFRQMLRFHYERGDLATLAVRQYDVPVPFGVVELEDARVSALVEKPVHRHFINAGIYVLHPDCLSLVPQSAFYDMTTLVNRLITDGRLVGSFPVHEYWQDVGQPADLDSANRVYSEMFSHRASR